MVGPFVSAIVLDGLYMGWSIDSAPVAHGQDIPRGIGIWKSTPGIHQHQPPMVDVWRDRHAAAHHHLVPHGFAPVTSLRYDHLEMANAIRAELSELLDGMGYCLDWKPEPTTWCKGSLLELVGTI